MRVDGAGATVRAGRREWAGLAVLMLPLLVLALDVSILYLALPELASDLGAGATAQLWVLDVYGFLIAGFLLTMGTVGDRIGRRRLLFVGAAAFAVVSVVAAWAPTAAALIAARAALGVAGATLMPSTLALITTLFRDPQQRAQAIAVWMTAFAGGSALGPVVGGLLLEHFWWGSVFLLGVPFLVLLLVLGPWLLPEDRATTATGRVDLRSVGLSLLAMLPLVYALKETVAHGPDALAAIAALVGATAGVAFVARQRRLADPMLDLALFRHRAFVGAVLLLFGALVALNGVNFLLPQVLQVVSGLGPAEAGLALVPPALVTVVGSLATPVVAARTGRWRLLTAGPVLAVVGGVALALVVGAGTSPAVVVGLVSVIVLGVVPLGVLGTDLVVSSAPPGRAGSAAAVSETAGELGVALGVALVGSFVAAVYGARMPALVPPGVPDDAVRAGAESVVAANGVAATLAPGPAADLRDAAASGFAEAFAAAGWLTAALGVVLVALAWASSTERGAGTGGASAVSRAVRASRARRAAATRSAR